MRVCVSYCCVSWVNGTVLFFLDCAMCIICHGMGMGMDSILKVEPVNSNIFSCILLKNCGELLQNVGSTYKMRISSFWFVPPILCANVWDVCVRVPLCMFVFEFLDFLTLCL